MERFWQHKSLTQMTQDEWEMLCDHCGKCCLHKLADEASEDLVFFTDVACRYLDLTSCRCKVYSERLQYVPDCIQVTADIEPSWLPPSCAYRRLVEGRDLPSWHPLVTGDQEQMNHLGLSIRNRVRLEAEDICLEEHMVEWPMFDRD